MVNFPNRPVQPGNPQPPVSGPQPGGPTQPSQPTPPTPAPPVTQPTPPQPPAQNDVKPRPPAPFDPLGAVPQATVDAAIDKLTKEMSEPEDRAALLAGLNDGNAANDVSQLKMVVLRNVREAFGPEVQRNLSNKLSQGENAEIYGQILQGFIDTYKNAPPAEREKALDNMVRTLSRDAAKIVNDVPVKGPDGRCIGDAGC